MKEAIKLYITGPDTRLQRRSSLCKPFGGFDTPVHTIYSPERAHTVAPSKYRRERLDVYAIALYLPLTRVRMIRIECSR